MAKQIKPVVEYNDKIRIKITEKCNLSCPFCHCEGTKNTEEVSLSDESFIMWLKELREHYSVVHLTGGEPTLYSNIEPLCKFLKSEGYKVFLTSNLLLLNENLFTALPYISKINISLHSFNSKYFKNFIKNNGNPEDYLRIIKNNILELKDKVDKISINAVVSNDEEQNLDEVLKFCKDNKILLKLVPDWRFYNQSREYILNFLKENNFVEFKKILKEPGSNLRILHKDKADYEVEFKDIRPYYLSFWCKNCKMKAGCIESFAFLRLEGNPLRFKICIDQPAISSFEFREKFWPKFKKIIVSTKHKNGNKKENK
ncbi:MAG: radical SAM protein [Patescibacteria group bacterium]